MRNLVYPFYVIPAEEDEPSDGSPTIQLDDRRFQDLVSEARLRINRACPEWTEHNVSDPGITLIELFAWMTEMTIYRLNRVPDKLHVALLELLGIQLDGPERRRAPTLRFRLAAPPTEPLPIPGGATEVGTPRTRDRRADRLPDARTSRSRRRGPPPTCSQRGGQVKDVGVADGEAQPAGRRPARRSAPRRRSATRCYLGFDEPLGRLLMQVDVDASPARGAGVDPEDPPLRWEVSQGDGGWDEAIVLEDLTGGFNYGAGTVELQLPAALGACSRSAATALHWLRCRIDDKTRHGGAATTYSQAPEIYSITAAPVGALLPALHAAQDERRDPRRVATARPGQTLPAALQPGAQARDRRDARGPGPRVRRLGGAGSSARLRRLDGVRPPLHASTSVAGEVELGPGDPRDRRRLDAVRRRPAEGRACCASRATATAAGARGNVAAGTLNMLQAPIPGVDTVTNPRARHRRRRRRGARARAPARGDGDPHPLPRGHGRGLRVPGRRGLAARRARGLPAAEATAARSRCTSCRGVYPADRQLAYDELVPDEELLQEVAEYLDERRLIGTTVQLLPCTLPRAVAWS